MSALKGKTVSRPGIATKGQATSVPTKIMEKYHDISLCVDIMYVNKIPFLMTLSRNIWFARVEHLENQHSDMPTTGQLISTLGEDLQWDTWCWSWVQGTGRWNARSALQHCHPNKHVPTIDHFICTIKDQAWCCYSRLPFAHVPKQVVIHLIYSTVFWLNAFPYSDRISNTLSPQYTVTGKHIDYHKHVHMEFGLYVQTHKEHSKNMEPRTIGSICLGPSGNEQGWHYFLSLMTRRCLLRHWWSTLPMPTDVIEHMNAMARAQGIPRCLAFVDWYGMHISDNGYKSDGSLSKSDKDSIDSDYQLPDDCVAEHPLCPDFLTRIQSLVLVDNQLAKLFWL